MLAQLERVSVQPDSVLLPPWTLPFATPESAVSSPSVLVWRATRSPMDCGRIVADLLLSVLGVDSSRIRVSASKCSPLEMRRRQDLLSFMHRLQGQTRERRHVQVLNYCIKCGQPLRDPASAQLGIGPECKKSYTVDHVNDG